MRKIVLLCVAALAAAGFFTHRSGPPRGEPPPLSKLLRARIEATAGPGGLAARVEALYCADIVRGFYARRSFKPAWVTRGGPSPPADSLLKAIERAHDEGLNPDDYHLEAIRSLMKKLRSGVPPKDPETAGTLVDLDLLLGDAFLLYSSHLLDGRVDPVRIAPLRHAPKGESDLDAELEKAVGSGRPAQVLRRLLPSQKGYRRLRNALRRYREISAAGGWPEVGGTQRLRTGSRGSAVAALRARLLASGHLRGLTLEGADVFDEELERALIRFQRCHGLKADGAVGPETRSGLNVPVEDRIEQIIVNMERFRWLPRDLGRRHIIVNVAGFELEVVEDGGRVAKMRVVVGRDYRKTPVFSDAVSYLVMSPRWNVPNTIAREDIIPMAREDPFYLADNRFRILEGWEAGAGEVDPASIDWSQVDPGRFKYRFVQDPGPMNYLGRIKFMFPNEFNVYLHDTPARERFDKVERTFSSGCIWVERPVELAEYLLRGAPGWTRERIVAAMNRGEERTVGLPEPVPVHILYLTAFVDDDGAVNFRKDIYDRDPRLVSALRKALPYRAQARLLSEARPS